MAPPSGLDEQAAQQVVSVALPRPQRSQGHTLAQASRLVTTDHEILHTTSITLPIAPPTRPTIW
jgi:hypothetical protein